MFHNLTLLSEFTFLWDTLYIILRKALGWIRVHSLYRSSHFFLVCLVIFYTVLCFTIMIFIETVIKS